MSFLLSSQAQGVSGKNEQSPWGGAPEVWGPMQLHWLHQLKAGPAYNLKILYGFSVMIQKQFFRVFQLVAPEVKYFYPKQT